MLTQSCSYVLLYRNRLSRLRGFTSSYMEKLFAFNYRQWFLSSNYSTKNQEAKLKMRKEKAAKKGNKFFCQVMWIPMFNTLTSTNKRREVEERERGKAFFLSIQFLEIFHSMQLCKHLRSFSGDCHYQQNENEFLFFRLKSLRAMPRSKS